MANSEWALTTGQLSNPTLSPLSYRGGLASSFARPIHVIYNGALTRHRLGGGVGSDPPPSVFLE